MIPDYLMYPFFIGLVLGFVMGIFFMRRDRES
jgi:hypothetical protein